MSRSEDLPGRWVDLRLGPVAGMGLGPALGWLAGALAAGRPLWTWPDLGWLLLGLFLVTPIWGRLWVLFGGEAGSLLAGPATGSVPESYGQNTPIPPPLEADTHNNTSPLPYTVPGSLSALWGAALGNAWRYMSVEARRRWLVEVVGLGGVFLVLTGLWGQRAFLAGLAGLALLGLRPLTWTRPAATAILRILGGLAWPWWLGQVVWGALTGEALLLSLFWGVIYAAFAVLNGHVADGFWFFRSPSASRTEMIRWSLLWADMAQGGAIALFFVFGQPIIGAVLALLLFGQVLLQAGLARADRWEDIIGRTWPFAALGVILSGLALGWA